MPISCRRGRLPTATKKRLDRLRSLNASRRCAICDGTTATARPHANASKRSGNAAKLSKHVCACIIRIRGLPIRSLQNSIRITSRRSVTGVTRMLRELNTLQNRLYGGTKFREIDSLPLREFVFSHAAQRVIPRFGNPDRMRGSCGIEWRARAHAQTDLA